MGFFVEHPCSIEPGTRRPLLELEKVAHRIRELAARRDAPFYVYDSASIRGRCAEFAAIPYREKSIHFASMANAHREFLRVVRAAGVNVFVNSRAHLEVAHEVGFRGEEVVYTASAMDEADMRRVREAGALLNLDSRGQLERWWQLFPGAPAGIRCNVGEHVSARRTHAGYFLGKESRLGLTPAEVGALAGERRIRGLHLYLGTGVTELAYFEECYRSLVSLARHFPALDYLDFGGGFGLPGAAGGLDMAAYGRFVTGLMEEVCSAMGRRVRLILEPGRLVGGEAGYFVCRVTDVKERDGLQLVGVNASAAQFPRPLFYPEEASHPVALLSIRNGSPAPGLPTSIYGCSTYSRDYLARDTRLPPARAGDLIVFGDAGSYCASAHTAFLGFPPAAELFL